MIRRAVSVDSVAVTGVVIGLISFWLGWLTLKSSRISGGISLSLYEILDWIIPSVILGLWLVCFILSFTRKGTLTVVVLGTVANLILILIFVFTGLTATELLEGELPYARVSLGVGFWITCAASYIVIFAACQRLDNSPIWRNLISWAGLAVLLSLLVAGWFKDLSVVQEFTGREERFVQELVHHIFLVGISVTVGTVFGIMLGIWASRSKRAEKPIFFITNITQTIPSLALFGLLIAPLSALSFAFPILREIGIRGVGDTPAIIALIIYSLLPVVRNTYVGLRQLDTAVIDAGIGMGMSRPQVFRKIEVPLAAPLVLEGVRIASVQSVGLAAIAALIGAGGLGWFVFQGLGQAAADLILLGAIPIIILALIVDAVMRTIVRLAKPRGLAGGNR
ncbi:ABC transporter permease [Chloroflexota bacterium]